MKTFPRCGLFILAYLFIAICSLPETSFAQPPITPSALNTQSSGLSAVGGQTQFNITGGTTPGGGANLLHSFGNFNLPDNNIANSLNNTGHPTSNMLGR